MSEPRQRLAEFEMIQTPTASIVRSHPCYRLTSPSSPTRLFWNRLEQWIRNRRWSCSWTCSWTWADWSRIWLVWGSASGSANQAGKSSLALCIGYSLIRIHRARLPSHPSFHCNPLPLPFSPDGAIQVDHYPYPLHGNASPGAVVASSLSGVGPSSRSRPLLPFKAVSVLPHSTEWGFHTHIFCTILPVKAVSSHLHSPESGIPTHPFPARYCHSRRYRCCSTLRSGALSSFPARQCQSRRCRCIFTLRSGAFLSFSPVTAIQGGIGAASLSGVEHYPYPLHDNAIPGAVVVSSLSGVGPSSRSRPLLPFKAVSVLLYSPESSIIPPFCTTMPFQAVSLHPHSSEWGLHFYFLFSCLSPYLPLVEYLYLN